MRAPRSIGHWISSRSFGVVVAMAFAMSASACRTEPFCLNCGEGGTTSPVDVVSSEVAPLADVIRDTPSQDVMPDIYRPDGCTVGAMEICNGVDDNCDGRIDEGIDLQTDPRNCGMCGNRCALAHAIPACTTGHCAIAPNGCDTNFYDLDMDPSNGCEYGCTPVPGATDDHTCDNRDDNCNGRIDEDINRCTDVRNCGMCGRSCNLAHAAARCARSGTGDCTAANTRCEVATCSTGFYDIDSDPSNGCEYECTPTGAETCDGRDNDCNGTVDDGDPGGGAACGSAVGACVRGVNHCRMGRLVCEGETTPHPETCNGMDDDCNGMTDDGTLVADIRIGVACGSGVGDCRPGRQVCTAGAVVCTGATGPVTESCDGRDNNCDGLVDNGVAAGGLCGSSRGACSQGTLMCVGGSMRCQGGTVATREICNMIDDDCDGTVDNGFDLQRDVSNCGTCGNACAAIAHAFTGCTTGTCRLLACEPGFVDRDANPANGCEYACTFQSASESCNGLDDNCNGTIDEGLTPPSGFCRSGGACGTPGPTPVCMGAMSWRCTYPAAVQVDPTTGQPAASETRCDGIDNNCNGAIDESFTNLGSVCRVGPPGTACENTGMFRCRPDTTGTECSVSAALPAGTEICDGRDNDCDGATDETALAPGANPSFVSTAWIQIAGSGASSVWMMQYEASRPGATAALPSTLSGRACSSANVLPWSNVALPEAAAACTAAGARLCTEAEWQSACVTNTATTCTWSYDPLATCGVYAPLTCNGVDYDFDSAMAGDQDGLLTTGALSHCGSDNTAGRIFDLSGNLREFTAPRAATVNPIRGGGYNSPEFGMTCQFNWSVVDDQFRFPNTGFRCCYTGATAP